MVRRRMKSYIKKPRQPTAKPFNLILPEDVGLEFALQAALRGKAKRALAKDVIVDWIEATCGNDWLSKPVDAPKLSATNTKRTKQ